MIKKIIIALCLIGLGTSDLESKGIQKRAHKKCRRKKIQYKGHGRRTLKKKLLKKYQAKKRRPKKARGFFSTVFSSLFEGNKEEKCSSNTEYSKLYDNLLSKENKKKTKKPMKKRKSKISSVVSNSQPYIAPFYPQRKIEDEERNKEILEQRKRQEQLRREGREREENERRARESLNVQMLRQSFHYNVQNVLIDMHNHFPMGHNNDQVPINNDNQVANPVVANPVVANPVVANLANPVVAHPPAPINNDNQVANPVVANLVNPVVVPHPVPINNDNQVANPALVRPPVPRNNNNRPLPNNNPLGGLSLEEQENLLMEMAVEASLLAAQKIPEKKEFFLEISQRNEREAIQRCRANNIAYGDPLHNDIVEDIQKNTQHFMEQYFVKEGIAASPNEAENLSIKEDILKLITTFNFINNIHMFKVILQSIVEQNGEYENGKTTMIKDGKLNLHQIYNYIEECFYVIENQQSNENEEIFFQPEKHDLDIFMKTPSKQSGKKILEFITELTARAEEKVHQICLFLDEKLHLQTNREGPSRDSKESFKRSKFSHTFTVFDSFQDLDKIGLEEKKIENTMDYIFSTHIHKIYMTQLFQQKPDKMKMFNIKNWTVGLWQNIFID